MRSTTLIFPSLARFWVKPEPFKQAFAAALSRNSPTILPFGNRPQVPPDDLGELPECHLEGNPSCPNSLNERLWLALRMESRHVIVTAHQDSVLQPDTSLNDPRTNSQHCPKAGATQARVPRDWRERRGQP